MDISFGKRIVTSEFAQSIVLNPQKEEEMHTSNCRNSIEARSLPIEIVDYRLNDIASHPGRHQSTVIQTWNKWVAECHAERHAEFLRPPFGTHFAPM